LLGTSRVEPLLRDIRNGMFEAGFVVESAKGECNLGQHEIAFKFDEAIKNADQHSIYKNGAKEIASLHGKALSFMAKFDQREGNSCHIHMSLRGTDGSIVFDEGNGGPRCSSTSRGHPGHDARADVHVCAQHQLLQAVPAGQLRADLHRMGQRQPHLLAASRRARRGAAAGEPPARR
jgi:hypothetical protein